jgi:Tfp pilus assembly protein PilP
VENPELRRDEITKAQRTEYKSSGRNPFSMQAAPEVTAAQTQAAVNAAPPYQRKGPWKEPPPQPPTWPGNVSFFGYGTVPNGTARRAFLTVDGEVQVVGEGDTLMGRYRIVQVNAGNLEFQDISTGLRNTKAMDAEKASAAAPPAASPPA